MTVRTHYLWCFILWNAPKVSCYVGRIVVPAGNEGCTQSIYWSKNSTKITYMHVKRLCNICSCENAESLMENQHSPVHGHAQRVCYQYPAQDKSILISSTVCVSRLALCFKPWAFFSWCNIKERTSWPHVLNNKVGAKFKPQLICRDNSLSLSQGSQALQVLACGLVCCFVRTPITLHGFCLTLVPSPASSQTLDQPWLLLFLESFSLVTLGQ